MAVVTLLYPENAKGRMEHIFKLVSILDTWALFNITCFMVNLSKSSWNTLR